MGKVTNNRRPDNNNECQRQKPEEKKKIRKRSKDLDDLHRKLCKPPKGKDTRTDGKLDKERNSRRSCNRIVSRPLFGIYRNGAVGKEIRRPKMKLPLNDMNNARLEGNVMKLLQGYDANSQGITIENNDRDRTSDPMLDSTAKEILNPTPTNLDCTSPILVKVDGRNRHSKEQCERNAGSWNCTDLSQVILEKKKSTNTKFQQHSAIQRYEELCATVRAESFDNLKFPNEFTAVLSRSTDPLTTLKKKLRGAYAETFRSQFLRDMIKRGVILKERTPSSSISSPILPEAVYSSSGYEEGTELIAANVDNSGCQNHYMTHGKETNSHMNRSGFSLSRSNFQLNRSGKERARMLFDCSILTSKSLTDSVESEQERNLQNLDTQDNSISERGHVSLEVNCSSNHAKNLMYSDLPAQQRSKTRILTQCEVPKESTSNKHSVKRKNQRTQTTSSLKRHPARCNAKMVQQVKTKNLRHMPAILRRCRKVNLFDEASLTDQTKKKFQATLFSPRSARTDATDDSQCTSNLVVQTCVIASPSLCQNGSQCDQQLNTNNIFSKRNKLIKKTVMFTRKDSRNAGNCLLTSDMMSERSVDDPSVCLTRKDLLQQQDMCSKSVCAAHRSCQRATTNCHRSYCCSQASDDSNYFSQEMKEAAQLRPVHLQEPVFCEKMLLKKIQQHPVCENNQHYHGKNQTVCFLTVDEDSSARQDYSGVSMPVMEKSRKLQDGICCQKEMADIGLLKGVQNLQILPMEESRVKCTGDRCIGKTVLLEEQPIKYLAIDNDSETQRVPIYVQKQPQFAATDNPDTNYRLVSCPTESTQKILFVPTREKSKVMYVKETSLNQPGVSFERITHPRNMLFYRPDQQNSSNMCEVHVPKQNVVEIGNHGAILQQRDHEKRLRESVGEWGEVLYRPSHEHTIVKDACAKSKTIYYKE